MRTTVDLPDDLLRRAKSEAALSGRKLRDLVEEGLRAVIDKADIGVILLGFLQKRFDKLIEVIDLFQFSPAVLVHTPVAGKDV
jgi:hypothetical protein